MLTKSQVATLLPGSIIDVKLLDKEDIRADEVADELLGRIVRLVVRETHCLLLDNDKMRYEPLRGMDNIERIVICTGISGTNLPSHILRLRAEDSSEPVTFWLRDWMAVDFHLVGVA